jgi:ankyrin repeat protein
LPENDTKKRMSIIGFYPFSIRFLIRAKWGWGILSAMFVSNPIRQDSAGGTVSAVAGRCASVILAGLISILAGCASLHRAAEQGDLAGMDRQLLRGVDVDVRDSSGRTPLMCTVSDLDRVRHLVEKGADVNARDVNGETPLMKAAFLGRLDVVDYLMKQGADVNARSERGATALMWAAGDLAVVKHLLDQGADADAKDHRGDTPLKWAATFGRLDVVEYLVEQGADVHARNAQGETPLDVATLYGHWPVADFLRELSRPKGARKGRARLAMAGKGKSARSSR